MAVRRTAISVPAELLAEIDRAAKRRGDSRSRFITRILTRAVTARRDADVTRRLNELFADEALAEADRCEAATLDAAGTAWDDERW